MQLRLFLLLCVMVFTFSSPFSIAQDTQLNGMAIHSELRRDIYIGALYAAVPGTASDNLRDSEQDKKMVLKVIASRWSARSFEQHWTQSILINNNEEDLASFADAVLAFTSALGGKLVSGDEVTINSPLGQPLTMSVNGVEVFNLADNGNKFFGLLLDGWIGARPPSSNFKRDILNTPDDIANLQTIFDSLTPSAERIAEVEAWADNPAESAVETEATTQAVAAPPEPSAEELARRSAARAAAAASAAKAKAEAEAEAAAKAEAERKAEEERIAKEVEQKNAGLRLLYRSNVMKMIYTRVVYPSRAIDRNQEGDVELMVRLKRNGKLIEATINTESKYNLLNKAALRAAEDASPYPPAPEKLTDKEIELVIPIRFNIPG